MFKKLLQNKPGKLIDQGAGTFVLTKAAQYLAPLEQRLDELLDLRLVRTFYDTFLAILALRERAMGLLLSELGAFIGGAGHAPAGTKRLSNLLRSKKWTAAVLDAALLDKADAHFEALRRKGKQVLMLWDDSRLEKPESWKSEGLCAVDSTKAKRLMKVKPGYYCPPASRLCVPGFWWTAVQLAAWGEAPHLVAMRWWTTRGRHAESADNIFYRLLRQLSERFGNLVVHVLDRGYASLAYLERLWKFDQHFIIRWKKNHCLTTAEGRTAKVHQLSRRIKSRSARSVYDPVRKKHKTLSIAYLPVQHPQAPEQTLFLVIVREHGRSSPMYLLTNLYLDSLGMAWQVCFSYLRRWEIEKTFRFYKCELAVQSPRLWFFENRLKLLAIVALVYDFLLNLLRNWSTWVHCVINRFCPRTGKRHRDVSMPLYRLRIAIFFILGRLWSQNSG